MIFEEKELVQACIQNDRKAQLELYNHFKIKMYGLCLRFGHNKEEAEDMLQEGFFKVFRDLHQFKRQVPLGAWIRKVIVNAALMHLRKRNRSWVPTTELEKHVGEFKTEGSIQFQMNAAEIIHAIQGLPTGFRTIFNLFAIEGYSHREIAEKLGISESTSRSQYTRARATLQKQLVKQGVV